MNKVRISTKTITRCSMLLGPSDVLSLLQTLDPPPPDDAKIFVTVPGGGDWSNEDLEIGDESNLEVRWEEETMEDSA